MLLAGDIGGTKTILSVFSPEVGPRQSLFEVTYQSGEYDSLEDIVQDFLTKVDLPIERASFGVAGPVLGGRATITNLSWVMEESQLKQVIGIPEVRLLNDLNAIANAVPYLIPEDLHVLKQGEPKPGGAIAVIAPGTGLGEGFLTWDGTRYRAHPSEGGHADFGPTNALQIELLEYLMGIYERVSYERISSGIGIPNIYAFLKEWQHAQEPKWLADQLSRVEDPTPLIVRAALDSQNPCPICVKTMDIFISVLGAEAGNLALKINSTGGVYLAGGIPPRLVSLLEHGDFLSAFLHKGRLSTMLVDMPVYLVLNPKVGLIGAACHGLEQGSF